MTTLHVRKQGKPKGSKPPATTASRVKKYRQNLRDTGGCTVTVNLDSKEIEQIEIYRKTSLLPSSVSRSEVIKSMACILGGGVYFIRGHEIRASVNITEIPEYPVWMKNYLMIP